MKTKTTENMITEDDLQQACARLFRYATYDNLAIVRAVFENFLKSHPELVIDEQTPV